MTGRRIDLDAARKARAETAEPPVVSLGGQDFTLPAGLPAIVAVGLARAKRGDLDGVEDAFTGLFGAHADEAMQLGLELDDLDVILEQAYGETPGE